MLSGQTDGKVSTVTLAHALRVNQQTNNRRNQCLCSYGPPNASLMAYVLAPTLDESSYSASLLNYYYLNNVDNI